MKRKSNKHVKAVDLIRDQIMSLRHEQESMFIAGERDLVNQTQDIINQLTSSMIALNELSVNKPLRNIKKLREEVINRQYRKDGAVSFDTMWHNNQVCAIIPTRILENSTLDI